MASYRTASFDYKSNVLLQFVALHTYPSQTYHLLPVEHTMPFPTAPLGQDGPQVLRQGFGLMGLSSFYGTPKSDEERLALLDEAYKMGAVFWDSADMYMPPVFFKSLRMLNSPTGTATMKTSWENGSKPTPPSAKIYSSQPNSPTACKASNAQSTARPSIASKPARQASSAWVSTK